MTFKWKWEKRRFGAGWRNEKRDDGGSLKCYIFHLATSLPLVFLGFNITIFKLWLDQSLCDIILLYSFEKRCLIVLKVNARTWFTETNSLFNDLKVCIHAFEMCRIHVLR